MKKKTMKLIKLVLLAGLLIVPVIYSQSLAAVTVTASGSDGNVPGNTIDGNLSTRWSSKGDGEWIQYDLGRIITVDDLDIAFHKSNTRRAYIDILVSEDQSQWDTVFDGKSSRTLGFQNFNITDTNARYVRIVGYGNSRNKWNSLTEVNINTIDDTSDDGNDDDSNDTDTNEITTTASSDDGHAPGNVLDNELSPESRWSAKGDGEWIQIDLGSITTVQDLEIAFYKGDSRSAYLDIIVSTDESSWDYVFSGASPERTFALQYFDIADTEARYIRIVGHGNSKNSWNSIVEVKFNTNNDSANSDTDPDTDTGTDTDTDNGEINAYLKTIFDTEGDSPFLGDNLLSFDALKSKHTTPNGNGWRNELKVKKDLRIAMSKTYEEFQADLTVNLSTGSKTIIAQHHASDTGTLMKVYVSDTSESGFENSKASDGIFDVYVRLRNDDGSEKKITLGTVRSGDSFNLHVINDYGDVSVSALGTTTSLKVKDDSAAYFKFGNYLQAQDPVTMKKVEDSDDFANFYSDHGITKSVITMTNVNYIRKDDN